MTAGLRHGSLGPNCVHLCVDMQQLFTAPYLWTVPWLDRILPNVELLCARDPGRTVFTRFLPRAAPRETGGSWRRYYRKWEEVTLERVATQAVEMVAPLPASIPPG